MSRRNSLNPQAFRSYLKNKEQDGVWEMGIRKSYTRLSCSECGDSIYNRTLWVDDGGLLCRHCAMLTRYRRMKGQGSWVGRRGGEVVYRGRGY